MAYCVIILRYLITIYTDASLTVWVITDGISPSRRLWHKAELELISVSEQKAIEIGIYIYCKNKDTLYVRVMCVNQGRKN